MHKNATKCNKTLSKWCKNRHEASKIIDTFETYHIPFDIFISDNPQILPRIFWQNLSSLFSAPLARELPQAQIPLFMGPKILSQNNPSFSGLSVL
jgi:hypothetical protein